MLSSSMVIVRSMTSETKVIQNHLKSPSESVTINISVAFLRKSGCRNAARFFVKVGVRERTMSENFISNRVAEMRKSGLAGLTHFLFF